MKKFILSLVCLFFIASSAFAIPGFPGKATNKTVTLTTPAAEYYVEIPTGASNLSIQSRTAADFKLSFVAGESGSNYYTVKSGSKYEVGSLGFISVTPNTSAFFQSGTAGQVIEVIYWQ